MYFLGCKNCEENLEKFPYTDETLQDMVQEEAEFKKYINKIRDEENAVIDYLYLGEHAEKIAEHIASWMGNHLNKKTPSIDFHNIWEEYENKGKPTKRVVGRTIDEIEGKLMWNEILGDGEELPDLDSFYRRAFNGKADGFYALKDNGHAYLVAFRGTPRKDDVEKYVLT